MAEKHELALNDYLLGMKYREIAEKYGVTIDAVKQWKKRHGWTRDAPVRSAKKPVPNVHKNKEGTNRVQKQTEKLDPEDEELTEQEQLFCLYYVGSWNARQAALKAGYGQKSNKQTANVMGCRLLKRPRVIEELKRIKELLVQDVYLEAKDVLQMYIKIAFADIGEMVQFYGHSVNLSNSEDVDTSLIQEVKKGKDGISIKLVDKMKALEKLELYFDLLPDNWRRKVEAEKLELERRKVEAAEKKAGDGEDDEADDDSFLKALEAKTAEVWPSGS